MGISRELEDAARIDGAGFFGTYLKIILLMSMSVMIVIPCVVVYFLAQRLFIQGVVLTGVKG